MVDREMLSAISGLQDEKLEDLKTKVDGLEADVKDLKADVSDLKGQMKHVRVVLLENNVIPRLDTVEKCYLHSRGIRNARSSLIR